MLVRVVAAKRSLDRAPAQVRKEDSVPQLVEVALKAVHQRWHVRTGGGAGMGGGINARIHTIDWRLGTAKHIVYSGTDLLHERARLNLDMIGADTDQASKSWKSRSCTLGCTYAPSRTVCTGDAKGSSD